MKEKKKEKKNKYNFQIFVAVKFGHLSFCLNLDN